MVWGAPTPCNSGGRSAVSASSGTRARSASTTAACRWTAAVPLVVSTIAGRPVAKPRPSAANAAERSSWWIDTASSRRSVRASAIGVEREPGATHAWVTPRRIHVSTKVAQQVAATSAARAPGLSAPPADVSAWLTRPAYGCRHGESGRSRARLHTDEPMLAAVRRTARRALRTTLPRCARPRRRLGTRARRARGRFVSRARGWRWHLHRIFDGRATVRALGPRLPNARARSRAHQYIRRNRRYRGAARA